MLQDDTALDKKLKALLSQKECRIGFECVAGDLTGQVFNAMPRESTLYIFGSLSLNFIGKVHPSELIFKEKSIQGFHLYHNVLNSPANRQSTVEGLFGNSIRVSLSQTPNPYEITVARLCPLNSIEDAFVEYKKNMSQGKILIDFCELTL